MISAFRFQKLGDTAVLKLHLDTDLGGHIDDLCALAMVLNWPGVELLAITTVADDERKRAGYTRYALELAGWEDIPVAAGADVALGCYRSRPGSPEEHRYWPVPIPSASDLPDQALSLLERSIEQGAIIAAIGPYTNLALLEKRSPGILRDARLYLMGGYVFPPRQGFPAWDHTMDYNVQVDVHSAQHVIQCSSPILIPISVTTETWLRRSHLATLGQSGPLAHLLAKQAEAFACDENFEAQYGRPCEGLPDDIINFQHDPLTCAVALGWNEGVEIREIRLKSEIEDGWLCQRIDDSGKPTRIVTRADGPRFSEFWLSTVAQER
ncbi:MAG: nucleoside hydrolase [Bryobacteraceae bacterium]